MLQTMPVKKSESTTSWEKYEGPRTHQPTEVHIQTCLTRDFSTLTHDIYITGPVDPTRLKPAPHGSRGVWRVGSSRVGSGGFQNLTGRVGSG